MAVQIGKVCIDDVNSIEELKKHGIYYLEKGLDDVIKNKTPLDYEFLVIDGSQECLFIKAIQCLFNNNWPDDSGVLKKIVENEIPRDRFDEKKCAKTVFSWMSRIIECFPGRIIIVSDNNKPEEWDSTKKSEQEPIQKVYEARNQRNQEVHLIQIQRWIKRRVCWIRPSDLDCKFQINEEEMAVQSQTLNCETINISLLINWLKSFSHSLDFILQVSLDDTGVEMEKKVIINNIKQIIFNLYATIEDAKNYSYNQLKHILIFPFESFHEGGMKDLGKWAIEFIKTKSEKELIKNEYIYGDFRNFSRKKTNGSIEKKEKIPRKSFMNFLKSIFENFKEEDFEARIINIPSIYKSKPKSIGNIEKFTANANKTKGSEKIILYERHGNINLAKNKGRRTLRKLDDNKDYYYYEALSGASPHFQVIASFLYRQSHEKINILLGLVENGLLKILIADERIAKFIDSEEKKKEFEYSGVYVLHGLSGLIEKGQDYITDYKKMFLNSYDSIKSDIENGCIDIFIIHQGLLDKNKELINENIIDDWKRKYFPYIVVTSGRGIPENIPSNTKFLPFSNIESTLMIQPISKFNLTKNLFKVISSSIKTGVIK